MLAANSKVRKITDTGPRQLSFDMTPPFSAASQNPDVEMIASSAMCLPISLSLFIYLLLFMTEKG